jgi:hypothetical protein
MQTSIHSMLFQNHRCQLRQVPAARRSACCCHIPIRGVCQTGVRFRCLLRSSRASRQCQDGKTGAAARRRLGAATFDVPVRLCVGLRAWRVLQDQCLLKVALAFHFLFFVGDNEITRLTKKVNAANDDFMKKDWREYLTDDERAALATAEQFIARKRECVQVSMQLKRRLQLRATSRRMRARNKEKSAQ